MDLYLNSARNIFAGVSNLIDPTTGEPFAREQPQPVPQRPNVQQAVKQLRDAMKLFNQRFSQQIDQFKPLWSTINNAAKGLEQLAQAGITLPPKSISAIETFTTTLQNAVAEETQDAQLLNQLTQQAQNLSAQISGFAQYAPQPQKTQRQPVQPEKPTQPVGRGWGHGIGQGVGRAVNWLGNIPNIPGNIGRGFRQQRASSSSKILTAAMGSALY